MAKTELYFDPDGTVFMYRHGRVYIRAESGRWIPWTLEAEL